MAAFREVPNIKAKAGSQGTLFQGGYPTGNHRGYSPERYAEVRQHTIGPQFTSAGGGTLPERVRMTETIARSTVPVGHIRGVKFTPGQSTLSTDGERSPAGIYHQKNDYKGISQPSIGILKGYEGSSTPIHEIGHAVSDKLRTPHSTYDTDHHQGSEEAYADNYAVEHFRDRKGNAMNTKRIYGGGLWNKTGAFRDGYEAARKFKTPEEAAVSTPNPHDRTYPASHVPGQMPLIHKVTSGYPAGTPADKAWGPPTLEINKEAHA